MTENNSPSHPPPTSTRRRFIQTSASLALAVGVASPVLLQNGCSRRRSDTLGVGLIGVGSRGTQLLEILVSSRRARIVAIADVDRSHREKALSLLPEPVPAFNDYRDLLDRKDVDAVVVATPDHWHTLQVVDACRAGKDVYCEKPLTLTIKEGLVCVRAVRFHNRILQVGHQQRSEYDGRFRRAAELVRNGYLGELTKVEIFTGEGASSGGKEDETAPPPGLDWDFWLGQAPEVPYKPSRCHRTFRWWRDYAGGRLTDWGTHHLDIVQWAMGTERTGPVRVSGKGLFPEPGGFDNAYAYQILYEYENGPPVFCRSEEPNGIRFSGTEGKIWVSRNGFRTDPVHLAEIGLRWRDQRLYYPDGEGHSHLENWLKCVLSREEPVCPVEVGHRAATLSHLGNIAIWLGRPVRWSPDNETVLADSEAESLLARPQREPYRIPEL